MREEADVVDECTRAWKSGGDSMALKTILSGPDATAARGA